MEEADENKAQDVGAVAATEAHAANPNLSQEVDEKVRFAAREQAEAAMKVLKVGSKMGGAAMLVLFKDAADKEFGVVGLLFDKKGDLVDANFGKPGTSAARSAVEDLKRDPEIERAMNEGKTRVYASTKLIPNEMMPK